MCFKEWNHHLVLAGALGLTIYSTGSVQSDVKLLKLQGDIQSIKPLDFKNIFNSSVIKEVLLTQ